MQSLTNTGTEPGADAQTSSDEVTFIYVHGFGEHHEVPLFHTLLDKFLSQWDIGSEVKTYRWDNLEFKPTMIVAQWNQSKNSVMTKVSDFTESIIRKHEAEKKPYVLIGYSLGSRLIAASLKEHTEPLNSLLGVYFLGSALPEDHQFADLLLPEGMKIANYYSGKFDIVLKFSFYYAEGFRAGGEKGFNDPLIENYRTVCNHLPKTTLFQRNYSSLAAAIAWQTYFKLGIFFIPDQEEDGAKIVNRPAGSGRIHWNEILRSGDIIIEQNANANIYRAVKTKPTAKRTTISWHQNMHQLLSQVDIYQPESIRLKVGRIES